MYGDVLAKLAGAAGPPPGGPAPAAQGLGLGPPPTMPNAPPPPTGVGPIPTGDPGTSKKAAADNAILALRELGGQFPNLKMLLDQTVDQIKAAASGPEPPSAPPSSPDSPPDASQLDASGTPGA